MKYFHIEVLAFAIPCSSRNFAKTFPYNYARNM